MTTATPQHIEALAIANATRSGMAEIKRELRAGGRVKAARLLLDPPEPMKRIKVQAFLCSLRQVGTAKAVELLKEAGLPISSLTWRVGPLYEQWDDSRHRTLTARQRAALADVLRASKHYSKAELA